VWAHSTVPAAAASIACSPGTSSPAAKTWMSKLPSVDSLTKSAIVTAAPKIVSSAFGNDEVQRHVIFGAVCAIAGAASVVAAAAPAPANPAFLMKLRRSIPIPPRLTMRAGSVFADCPGAQSMHGADR
jgi:hypothetical protein